MPPTMPENIDKTAGTAPGAVQSGA